MYPSGLSGNGNKRSATDGFCKLLVSVGPQGRGGGGVGDKSRVLFATTSECVLEHVVSVCLANMWGKWLENIARGEDEDQEEDRKLCYMNKIKLCIFVCNVVYSQRFDG